MPGHRIFHRIVTVTAGAVLGLSACSGGGSPPPRVSVEVTVQDFKITPSTSTLRAGMAVVLVHDRGPSTHELVIVRTDLPADKLPLRPDGLLVDEESPQLQPVGELSELDVGDRAHLVLNLTPGRYVFFCNLEGHYLGGMHALLQVGNDPREGDAGA